MAHFIPLIQPGDEVFNLRLGQTGTVIGRKVYIDKRIINRARIVFVIKRPGHDKVTYWVTDACVKSSTFSG